MATLVSISNTSEAETLQPGFEISAYPIDRRRSALPTLVPGAGRSSQDRDPIGGVCPAIRRLDRPPDELRTRRAGHPFGSVQQDEVLIAEVDLRTSHGVVIHHWCPVDITPS